MSKLKKIILAWALVTALALAAVCGAVAEGTTLSITLAGLTAVPGGAWQSVALTGSFIVQQDGREVGVLEAGGGASLSLPGSGNVTLVPVADSMPQGYLIQTAGYSVSITQGRANNAPVMLYADAGLFTLQTAGVCEFVMTTPDGEEVAFVTDETGAYASDATPSGAYLIRQVGAPQGAKLWPDFVLTIEAYRGRPEQIVAVDEAYALAAQPTAPPEPAAPASTATIAPTSAPSDEPTAAAAEMSPKGGVALSANGAVPYAVSRDGVTLARGEIPADGSLERIELEPGDYVMTAEIPAGWALLSLNDSAAAMKGQVTWVASVEEGRDQHFALTLARLGSLSGETMRLTGASLTAEGPSGMATASADGAYRLDALLPGSYRVSVRLPKGEYVGEGWQFEADDEGVTASLEALVEEGETAVLPAISPAPMASVSGEAVDDAGRALAGAVALLTDAQGQERRFAVGEDGQWRFGELAAGLYTLRLQTATGMMAPDQSIELRAGEEVSGLRVTAAQPGSIRVNAFLDSNNNGRQGEYERPVANITVSAIPVGSADGRAAASAVTGKNGQAVLEGLAPGQYSLRVSLPTGYGYAAFGEAGRLNASMLRESAEPVQDSEPIEIVSGMEAQAGVGVASMAVVSGYVWLDVNGDGVRQDDEPGQAGVVIDLVVRGGDTRYSLVTGEDGRYIFGAVEAGEYNIRATAPEGLAFTRYAKKGGDKRSIITAEGSRKGTKLVDIKAGTALDEQNIGLVQASALEVRCFLDANYNGLYDEGELPLAGVRGELSKQNGTLVATRESDENGLMLFDGLRANSYSLRAVLPEGAAFTLVADGPAGNRFKPREGRRENTVDQIELGTGERKSMVVGGLLPGTIGGVCYLDDNFSASRDDGEEVVSGLTVILRDASGSEIARCRTNAKGAYSFTNVAPGSYAVALNAKRGYAFTKLGEGNAAVNMGEGAGETAVFELALGESREDLDIGMIRPGVVQGRVFADRNDNGLMDEGEGGLVGTVVRLMDDSGEWFAATIGEDGLFRFDAVMPGRYYLRYELPERGVFARKTDGGSAIAGEDGAAATAWFDFTVGGEVEAPLCGGLTLGSVSGHAFEDHNGSGIMEEGEGLLAGLTLTLTPSRADLEPVTVTTGADGAFSLTGLRPDTYELHVACPDGRVLSRTALATLPVRAGEASQRVSLTIGMGDMYQEQQLGCVVPASLAGVLWLDENNDGRRGGDEQTPAGMRVTVIDQATEEIFAVLSTDSQGVFAADGLIPGSYTLRYELDAQTIPAMTGDSTFRQEGNALVMRDVRAAEGSAVDGLSLGIVRYTSLGGQVWVDRGGTVQPLPGAAMTLMDAGGTALQQVQTDEAGGYRFDGLLPGDYGIAVLLPEGQVVVEPGDSRLKKHTSIMTWCAGRGGSSDTVTVRMGQDQLSLDVGSVLPGRLGDLVWLDENGNGLQETEEGGIPGVQLELLRDGQVVAQTVTDQYGFYLFDELYPADYAIRATAPETVKPTRQRGDVPGIGSVLPETEDVTVTSDPVGVSSDRSNYNADLGYVLRTPGVYPQGYGQGEAQDWTKILAD